MYANVARIISTELCAVSRSENLTIRASIESQYSGLQVRYGVAKFRSLKEMEFSFLEEIELGRLDVLIF